MTGATRWSKVGVSIKHGEGGGLRRTLRGQWDDMCLKKAVKLGAAYWELRSRGQSGLLGAGMVKRGINICEGGRYEGTTGGNENGRRMPADPGYRPGSGFAW